MVIGLVTFRKTQRKHRFSPDYPLVFRHKVSIILVIPSRRIEKGDLLGLKQMNSCC